MKALYLSMTLLYSLGLAGCALGSATSAYSVNSKNADELGANARKSIVDEAVQKSKEYVDQTCVKK